MTGNGTQMIVEVPHSDSGEVIMLEAYKGTWSLVLAKASNDGKVYKRWCYPEKRDGSELVAALKSIPWKIELGKSNEEALNTLRHIAKFLMPR